jgi:hypothetical protein
MRSIWNSQNAECYNCHGKMVENFLKIFLKSAKPQLSHEKHIRLLSIEKHSNRIPNQSLSTEPSSSKTRKG